MKDTTDIIKRQILEFESEALQKFFKENILENFEEIEKYLEQRINIIEKKVEETLNTEKKNLDICMTEMNEEEYRLNDGVFSPVDMVDFSDKTKKGINIRNIITKKNMVVQTVYMELSDEEIKNLENRKFNSYIEKNGEKFPVKIRIEKNKKYMGLIAVSDIIKEDSAFAISKLRKLGIKTIMMTGDNEKTAHAIGMKAGVDQIFANVLPDAKEKNITQWKEQGLVAMVGDGINDAPALASADIGMAIGAGTDVAIESADVVLVNSSLMDIVSAVQLSRATLKNVYQNLFWGFAYNMTLIPLAAGLYPNIHITPMWGAAIMALSSVTVCLNALRLNNVKLTRPTESSNIVDQKEMNTSISVKENKEMKVAITIEGMMCGHCEMMVKKAFEEMDAVISAEVSHEKGQAILTLKSAIQEADIKAMLESKGYKFKHFKNLD